MKFLKNFNVKIPMKFSRQENFMTFYISRYTCAAIPGRGRFNAQSVAGGLYSRPALLNTAEFTVEWNRTIVTSVRRLFVRPEIWRLTWESTRETNHSSVHCVTDVSVLPVTCRHTNAMYTATRGRTVVATVGRCLKEAAIWSIMLLITLLHRQTPVQCRQRQTPPHFLKIWVS